MKEKYQIHINIPKTAKMLESKNYNLVFNWRTGFLARWGKTEADDPQFSPFGPELLDIEICSGKCSGPTGTPCKFCYKSNGKGPVEYMNLDTFKKIFSKLPPTLTQIAFGITDIDANPDMFSIFEACRIEKDVPVIPNVTINGYKLDDDNAYKLAKMCGAVAVSHVTTQKKQRIRLRRKK